MGLCTKLLYYYHRPLRRTLHRLVILLSNQKFTSLLNIFNHVVGDKKQQLCKSLNLVCLNVIYAMIP